MNDANEVGFDFGDGANDDSEAPDFTGLVPLGPCPKCKSRVFETAQAYVCEKAVGPDKTCDFRSGRVILQRPVERAQMEKLLATGKTDLLQFVSARTKRGFSAFLVRQLDGKIGFEFEARDPAKAGARRARGGASALRVLGEHPVFAVHGHEVARPGEGQHPSEIVLAGVTGDVQAGIARRVDARPAPAHVVDHVADLTLVAGNDARRQDHRVVRAHMDGAVVVHGDTGERR